MSFKSLCNSLITVRRLTSVNVDGAPSYTWQDVQLAPEANRVRCEPGFLRPGKDQPMAVEAGKTPPRVGVLWAQTNCGLLSGDRITFVTNWRGELPVSGSFELRVPPDEAQGYSSAHHIEVQIVEVAQAVANGERTSPDTEDDI